MGTRWARDPHEENVWRVDADGLHIVLHRIHGITGAWFASCRELGIDSRDLPETDVLRARVAALRVVETELAKLNQAFARILKRQRMVTLGTST